MAKNDDPIMNAQDSNIPAADNTAAEELLQAAKDTKKDTAAESTAKTTKTSAFDQIKQQASEDDDAPVGTLTLRKILGGDILSAEMVRRQVWLLLLIVLFITAGVAVRYQCQQDLIDIDKLETKLTDVKYRALASSSNLTERCRESHVLQALKNGKDSLLHISSQPPYIVNVDEE